jgi:hypothetical protein
VSHGGSVGLVFVFYREGAESAKGWFSVFSFQCSAFSDGVAYRLRVLKTEH